MAPATIPRMIHLDCPKCGTELEMDSAFRGSVCRCHACGALIKVPRKRRAEPRVVHHTDRPDSPLDVAPATSPTPGRATGPHLSRRQRRRRSSRKALWFVITFVLIGLGAMAFFAYRRLNP